MFKGVDILDVTFVFKGQIRVHKCVTRLPETFKGVVVPGMRFSITSDSDGRVGAVMNMTLSDIQGHESVELIAEMVTAEHLKKVSRGWYAVVEVKEILKTATSKEAPETV